MKSFLKKNLQFYTAAAILSTTSLGILPGFAASAAIAAEKTTVILVYGAFAGSDSWNGVAGILGEKGYTVVSAANPLRGVQTDAAYVSALTKSIQGPVVMVGHSYGGTVITNAATGKANVKALVYVGAFAPDAGESVVDLAGKYPGSTLGPSLAPPVVLADGGKDLYIAQDKFHQQFAADVPQGQAQFMAATQRPITEAAILEKSAAPAWKSIPSWFVYGLADKNIPPAAMKFMGTRANGRKVVEIPGASHLPHVTHAKAVADMIDEAAKAN